MRVRRAQSLPPLRRRVAAPGQLRLGVLQAQNPGAASRRLSTYQLARQFEALTVDEAVSEAWALLISRLRAAGRKAPVNDSWIAATAIARRVPVVTQDSDYDDSCGVVARVDAVLAQDGPQLVQLGVHPGQFPSQRQLASSGPLQPRLPR